MRQTLGRRQRAQTIVVAALAMTAIVCGVAMVIDVGMFLVAQRQLQTAADAGALAGAWYEPVCPTPAPGCKTGSAKDVAKEVAQANADTIKQLCGGAITIDKDKHIQTGTPEQKLVMPRVNWIVVTVECSAGYSFGRILGLDRKTITASAAAGIGDRDANGDIADFNPQTGGPRPSQQSALTAPLQCDLDGKCRVARLLQ
jgi:hypothetical protein